MAGAPPALSDVDPSKVFRTCNGVVLRNVSELANWLQGCSEYDFRYHVNMDHAKNDFAIWVREVVGDEALACDLDGELDRLRYADRVRRKIRELNR
jgi:hypothetical protein